MYDEVDQLDFSNMDDMRGFIGRYADMPAIKGVQSAYEQMNEKERQAILADSSRYISAIRSGKPELAINDLKAKAEAHRNMGDESKAKEAEDMAKFIEMSPEAALGTLSMGYAVMSPKDAADNYKAYSDAFVAQDKTPAEIAKVEAEAKEIDELLPYRKDEIKSTEVKNLASAKDSISQANNRDALTPYQQAEMTASASEKTAGASLKQTQADYIPKNFEADQAQREVQNQINQIKLQLQSESNAIQRERLGIQLAQLEQKSAMFEAGLSKQQVETQIKNQERLADYENSKESLSVAKATVSRLLNNTKGMNKAVGVIDSKLPTFRPKSKEFEKDLQTLKSQVFLAQVSQMRGLGALTEAEGAKLEASISNLSLDMDEKTLKQNLLLVHDYMSRADKRLQTKYKDLISEASQNNTGSIAGRSYMSVLN
ncbi:hypothetical protein [Psychrobacter pygoscelis]|uniref:hypothetical protein n=1 Tax=Psychrobacter pygoscelis TaxID=2488563 RepID=UPI00103ABA94|nr:hypothetical protein [Psychrobacter pygoscelis]